MKLPYKHVMASFVDASREYCYFVDVNTEVAEGNWVIVWVRNAPTLAKITRTTGITKAERDRANKIIGGVVGCQESWKNDMERLKTYLDFRAQLTEMREQHDEMAIFMALAKDNPAAQKLISDMNEAFGTEMPVQEKITQAS